MAKWHYLFVFFLVSKSYLEIQIKKKKNSLMEVVCVLLVLVEIYHLIVSKINCDFLLTIV